MREIVEDWLTLYQADFKSGQVKKDTRRGEKKWHCFMWWSRRIDETLGNVFIVSALLLLQLYTALIVVLRRSISFCLQVFRLKSPQHPAQQIQPSGDSASRYPVNGLQFLWAFIEVSTSGSEILC